MRVYCAESVQGVKMDNLMNIRLRRCEIPCNRYCTEMASQIPTAPASASLTGSPLASKYPKIIQPAALIHAGQPAVLQYVSMSASPMLVSDPSGFFFGAAPLRHFALSPKSSESLLVT